LGLCAGAALAQDPPQTQAGSGFELGLRWWVSTGSTQRSHDASGFAPGLVGNPTSTLAYTNLDANAGELFARKTFAERWFVKGNLGLGKVNTGTFTDQDFFFVGGAPSMTQTVSAADGKLNYASIDVGREMWKAGVATFSLFAGLQQWNERIDAHGFSDSFGPAARPPGVLVISNDLTWNSFRFGGEMRAVRGRTRFSVEAALVPRAKYRNEDSHYLRQDPSDLGPAPNVIATGHGWGGQLEAEVRRSFPQLGGIELGLGYRYWRLESQAGNQTQAGLTFPIVDLVSERQGMTLTLSKSW
jgi:hypothetical protein